MATRNFIIILVLIPLLLIIGAAVYFLGPWGNDEEKSGESESGIKVLVSEAVISPVLSFDGEKIWYATPAGKMFRIPITPYLSSPTGGEELKEGEKEEYLLPQPLEGITQVIWPGSGNDFLVELATSEGANQFAFYNGTNRTFHSLSPLLRKASFLANPEKIVYEFDGAVRELKVSNKDGSDFRKVAELKRSDYEIAVSPAKDEAVLLGSDNLEPSFLILVDLATGKFTDLDQKDFYKEAKFSPDGTKLAVLRGEGGLTVYDLNQIGQPPLRVRGGEGRGEDFTWSADSKTLILADETGFFRYDLESITQSEIYKFKEAEKHKPINIIAHPQKNLLFFVDQTDRFLYQVDFPSS
ncbi:MAG: WD40 repeat domain-containing protein [bacterium]|nr:WD40 repeat domain-containing protein [bacterium]